MRNRIKALAMAEQCDIHRKHAGVPVVVYINRQLTNRRLVDGDAEALLKQMNKLNNEGVIEFYNAVMEELPRVQQVSAVTTVRFFSACQSMLTNAGSSALL